VLTLKGPVAQGDEFDVKLISLQVSPDDLPFCSPNSIDPSVDRSCKARVPYTRAIGGTSGVFQYTIERWHWQAGTTPAQRTLVESFHPGSANGDLGAVVDVEYDYLASG
jgi:hypothetical protein